MAQNTNVEDFDDLGQPISFSYRNKTYEIPIPTHKKSKELLKMGREIQQKSKANEIKVKEYEEKGEAIPDEINNAMDELLDFQLDFVITAGIEEVTEIGKKTVDKKYLEEEFPNKLIQRIFRKINENFAESEQEKKS